MNTVQKRPVGRVIGSEGDTASWQVIPRELEELSGDYTTAAHQRVCQAMLKMGKIDVAGLQAAYEGA